MNDTTQQAPAAPDRVAKGYQIWLDGKPVDIAAMFTSHDRDKRLIGDLERALELVKNDRRIAEARVTELEARVRELEGELHTVRQQRDEALDRNADATETLKRLRKERELAAGAESEHEPEAKPLPAGDAPADVGERLHQAYRALYSAHGIKLAAWDSIGDWEREWWKGLARKPAAIGAERDAAKAERDEAKTAAQYASDEVDARNKRIAELERDVDWYKEAKTDRGIELDRVRRDREQARDAEMAEKTAKEEAWTEAKQLRERLNRIAAYVVENAGLAEAPPL